MECKTDHHAPAGAHRDDPIAKTHHFKLSVRQWSSSGPLASLSYTSFCFAIDRSTEALEICTLRACLPQPFVPRTVAYPPSSITTSCSFAAVWLSRWSMETQIMKGETNEDLFESNRSSKRCTIRPKDPTVEPVGRATGRMGLENSNTPFQCTGTDDVSSESNACSSAPLETVTRFKTWNVEQK
jgi:hypothetical protein